MTGMARTPTPAEDVAAVALLRRLTADGTARALRVRHRLSLAEVAQVVGATPGAVWKWECGRRSIRGEEAARRYAALLARLVELEDAR